MWVMNQMVVLAWFGRAVHTKQTPGVIHNTVYNSVVNLGEQFRELGLEQVGDEVLHRFQIRPENIPNEVQRVLFVRV